jgi:hypothetical protein
MSFRLAEFPQDVLLELSKHLDVSDLISFLSVCGNSLVETKPETIHLDMSGRSRASAREDSLDRRSHPTETGGNSTAARIHCLTVEPIVSDPTSKHCAASESANE